MWDILSEETDARQGSTATASSPGSAPEEGAATSSWPWKLLGRTSDIMKPSRFGPAVLAQLRGLPSAGCADMSSPGAGPMPGG